MHGRVKKQEPLGDPRLAQAGLVSPMVTVVVTNYNYENYIAACLESIARQSYSRFKCVIVDDCSQDSSVRKIREFIDVQGMNSRFELVRHKENSGQMAAFKTGLEHSEGPFVVFVDSADILFDDFIESHVAMHLAYLPVAFTSSNQYQINEHDEVVAGNHPDLQHGGKTVFVGPRPLHKPFWIWATTSSMMFRKAILELITPDDCKPFRICADNYLCHYANLIGGSILMPGVHGCYRRHGENGFSKNPIVGGRLPTGDLRKHPHHEVVKARILEHLLQHSDKLISLLTFEGFTHTILKVRMLSQALALTTGPHPNNCKLPNKIQFIACRLRMFIHSIRSYAASIASLLIGSRRNSEAPS